VHISRSASTLVLAAVLALVGAACGDDDSASDAASATTQADTVSTTETPSSEPGESMIPDDVCALVGDEAASEATGLELSGATADGNGIRNTCTYSARDNDGVGITVGVQSGGRFDDKAATSERALGPGEPVDDLGDRALSFYDDEDIAEGVGGTLVAVGEVTIDVSIQGLDDEAATREAANALAALVVDGL